MKDHDYHTNANRRANWDKWSAILAAAHSKLDESGFPDECKVRSDYDDCDSTLFHVCMAASMPPYPLNTLFRHRLKNRLWRLGDICRVLHNTMMLDREGDEHVRMAFELLTRKCFKRLQYIIKDMGT